MTAVLLSPFRDFQESLPGKESGPASRSHFQEQPGLLQPPDPQFGEWS